MVAQMDMPRAKTKIVAVARNEGYFLPHWVYHHFYMGFDAIDVHVNRTCDRSLEILARLQRAYPALSFYDSDWVDKIWPGAPDGPSMQHTVYTWAYFNAMRDYDYIFCLDIDEFWLPRRKGEKIQDCLRKLNYPNACTFEWLNVDGADIYSWPFIARQYFAGCVSVVGKSVLRKGLRFKALFQHCQPFNDQDNYVLADGAPAAMQNDFFALLHENCVGKIKDYFVLHDWMRSPVFYLSNIANGRASVDYKESFEKLNHTKPLYNQRQYPQRACKVAVLFDADYTRSYEKLLEKCNLTSDLDFAKAVRYLMALAVLRQLRMNPEEGLTRQILSVFGNLDGIRSEIVEWLAQNLPGFPQDRDFDALNPQDMIAASHEETRNNFRRAIAMYPFVLDQWDQPLFLKEYFRYLVNAANFAEAMALLADKSLLTNQAYDQDWAIILLARAYEKHGMIEQAIKYYKRSRYAISNEARGALLRLQAES